MNQVLPSMRLKLNRDTYHLPDSDGSVYFRNHACSFRMEGATVAQWIEKLLPAFTGQYTMDELTDGLPEAYQSRVYEMANALLENGFLRDVSQDAPHQLSAQVLETYASHIEWVDQLAGSGAAHFQSYRESQVLVIGEGRILLALVAALFESGLCKVAVQVLHQSGNRQEAKRTRRRLHSLLEAARGVDAEMELQFVQNPLGPDDDSRYDTVAYASEDADLDLLRHLESLCHHKGMVFCPVVCVGGHGVVGPFIADHLCPSWDAMWRRLHSSAFARESLTTSSPSGTSSALMANLLVFQLLKHKSGAANVNGNQVYLLNLETLEGQWHTFYPHPGDGVAQMDVEDVIDLREELTQEAASRASPESEDLLELISFFGGLTDATFGIFERWEEGDLKQLPLSQALVEVVNPTSHGPCAKLVEQVCAGMTHEEARKEAGLWGVERYVLALCDGAGGRWSVGAGSTIAEGAWRAIHKALQRELATQMQQGSMNLTIAEPCSVDDERCQYYLHLLDGAHTNLVIAFGTPVCGFPVVWAGFGERLFGTVGLNHTMALRRALQALVMDAVTNDFHADDEWIRTISGFALGGPVRPLSIPSVRASVTAHDVLGALDILHQSGYGLDVCDLAVEPFLKDGLAGVFGVHIRREELQ